jgi:hypothetical protein
MRAQQIGKVMRQRTAVFYRRLTGSRVWQNGYFERVLRPDDDIQPGVESMMANRFLPVW